MSTPETPIDPNEFHSILPIEIQTAEFRYYGGLWSVGRFVSPPRSQRYRESLHIERKWLIRKGPLLIASKPPDSSFVKLVHSNSSQHIWSQFDPAWRILASTPQIMADILW